MFFATHNIKGPGENIFGIIYAHKSQENKKKKKDERKTEKLRHVVKLHIRPNIDLRMVLCRRISGTLTTARGQTTIRRGSPGWLADLLGVILDIFASAATQATTRAEDSSHSGAEGEEGSVFPAFLNQTPDSRSTAADNGDIKFDDAARVDQ